MTKSPEAETTTLRLRCADVPPGEAVVVAVRDDLKVAVFQLEDGYWAIDNRCPHRGGQIGASGGYVYRGTTVVCPWHGYRIDLQTGCVSWTIPSTVRASFPWSGRETRWSSRCPAIRRGA